MKKTQVLRTKQGLIVKIDHNAENFDRVFKKHAKANPTLHHIGYDGDYSVFSDTYHTKRETCLPGWGHGLPTATARKLQGIVVKMLQQKAVKLGVWHSTSSLPPGWQSKLGASKAALRYAFNPNAYTAVPTRFPVS